jgi:hypothetical protein
MYYEPSVLGGMFKQYAAGPGVFEKLGYRRFVVMVR